MPKKVTWTAQSLNTSNNIVNCKGAFRVLLINRGTQSLYYKKQMDSQYVLYVPGMPEDSPSWFETLEDAGDADYVFDDNLMIKFDGTEAQTQEAYAKVYVVIDEVEEIIHRENLPTNN